MKSLFSPLYTKRSVTAMTPSSQHVRLSGFNKTDVLKVALTVLIIVLMLESTGGVK